MCKVKQGPKQWTSQMNMFLLLAEWFDLCLWIGAACLFYFFQFSIMFLSNYLYVCVCKGLEYINFKQGCSKSVSFISFKLNKGGQSNWVFILFVGLFFFYGSHFTNHGFRNTFRPMLHFTKPQSKHPICRQNNSLLHHAFGLS